MGYVLRDVGLLQDLLDDLGPRPGFPRGALMVGLGLLGEPVSFERAAPDGSDPDAAAAWALGTILASWEEAEAVLAGHEQDISGAARRTLETALRRVRSGYLISAVG